MPTSKWHFVPRFPNGSPKIPKVGTPTTLGPMILCANLRLRWGLKQSCNPHWELCNHMLHTTYTQGNRINSRLLVVKNQIANLTFDLSFGHNLCLNCPNESYEPILTSTFQYIFNDIKNFSIQCVLTLEIAPWRFRRVQQDFNSQSGNSPASVRVHSLTLSCTPGI
jgi:hypothetical protein